MGLGGCSCLGAEPLQMPGPRQSQSPELHPEGSLCSQQGGTGAGLVVGRLWGCGCQGAPEPPTGASPPEGDPRYRGRARIVGHGHGKGLSGSTSGLSSLHQSCGTICLTKHRCLFKEKTKHS